MTLMWPLRLTGVATQDELTKAAVTATSDGIWKLRQDPLCSVLSNPSATDATRYAEFVYFHPFVRRFLYEPRAGHSPLRILERDDIRHVDATFAIDPAGYNPALPPYATVRFRVDSVRAHLFRTGVVILAVELAVVEPLPLHTVQAALDQIRRAYRPYFEKCPGTTDACQPGHCPAKVQWLSKHQTPLGPPSDYDSFNTHWAPVSQATARGEADGERQPPFAAHWLYILPQFGRGHTCAHLLDDRIPTMAFVAVDDPTKLTDGDFFRLGYLDEVGASSNLPYSTAFYNKFLQDSAYDRFWDPHRQGHAWMTTRYFTTGYAFVVIGSSRSGFFMDPENGALAHFRNHYYQLFLIAHLQHSSLINFSHELATLVDDVVKPSISTTSVSQKMDTLHRRFADFVARFWFDEISNQIQARELFDLLRKNLGTSRLYSDVAGEIENVATVIAARMQARISNIGLAFTLIAGFLGLMQLTKVRDAVADRIAPHLCGACDPRSLDWCLEVALAVLLLIGSICLWRCFRIRNQNPETP